MVTTGGIFVGRQREMGELKAALQEAIDSHGRVVMLVGEPGSGKTRTSEELAALAQHLGAAVLWGRCPEEGGAPPYWPWAQAIRACVMEREPEALWAEMGAGAADIAQIVAEVNERLPGLQPPPPLDDPEQARFRLFDSITSFLQRASTSRPLLLVLDNLHWADPSSLRLLEFVAQELAGARVLLMGTYRDTGVSRGHPLFRTLGELTRQRLYQRVLLRGLSKEEVGQVIAATGSITPPAELVDMVHRQTEGNPLFVGEVMRLLAQEGLLQTERLDDLKSWDFRLPEGVREVIGRRLDRLSSGCNQALTLASVIGAEFSLSLLGKLTRDQSEEQLLGVLEEALAAGVIQELPGSAEDYQFGHALIRETLASELSAARKVRLHAHIAETLEELYGAAAETHAAELAYHFGQAKAVLGTEKVVNYSLLAGERALTAYAWEEALAHFQRGLVAKGVPLEGTEPAKDAEAAALLFGLGRAQTSTAERSRWNAAVDILDRAFSYYEKAGDVAQAVAVAEYPLPTIPAGRSGIAPYIPRALKLVSPDSSAAGRLLSTYISEIGRVQNDHHGARQAFNQAMAIARREQDVALEARTLAAAAEVDFYHLRLPEALEKAEQAIELARRLDNSSVAWLAHSSASRILTVMGGSEREQQKHATAVLELAGKLRDRFLLAVSFRINTTLCCALGDWRRARDFSDRGLVVYRQDSNILRDRILLEYEVGDFSHGETYLEQLLATPIPATARPSVQYTAPAQVIPWVARITGVLDRLEVAEAAAQAVITSPFSNPLFVRSARAGLGLLAVLRQDRPAAEEQYLALEPSRGTSTTTAHLSMDCLLGLLAHTMGNLDRAAQHFEDSLGFCRKAGYRRELAWSCYDYADLLLSRNSPGDQQKAMSLLDESLSISIELGMRPLMERVLGLRGQAEARPARALAYPDGLTQREVEVVRLVAVGKSNLEIGEALFISTNTVLRHVSNIFSKTGAANRVGLAAYAVRHGLVSM